jgi:hypothetical protein
MNLIQYLFCGSYQDIHLVVHIRIYNLWSISGYSFSGPYQDMSLRLHTSRSAKIFQENQTFKKSKNIQIIIYMSGAIIIINDEFLVYFTIFLL